MAEDETSVDVTQGMPGQWVTTPVEELREGDLVRGLDEAGRYGALTPEAAVESIDDEYVYLVGSGGWNIGRTFERWVPAEAQATGRWDSVTLDLLSVGDRWSKGAEIVVTLPRKRTGHEEVPPNRSGRR